MHFGGARGLTVAQTDRRTHKGEDSETQEETNKQTERLRGRASGTASGQEGISNIEGSLYSMLSHKIHFVYDLTSAESLLLAVSLPFHCKCTYYYSITYVTYISLTM